jgi:hypothetical protein
MGRGVDIGADELPPYALFLAVVRR